MTSEKNLSSYTAISVSYACRYYTGYPKDLGPSRVIHFTSEREFVHLLHQGHPVIVAFTIKNGYYCSKNEDFFEKFRWVCHLDQKMSVMGNLFRLLIHQKDKVEVNFMEFRLLVCTFKQITSQLCARGRKMGESSGLGSRSKRNACANRRQSNEPITGQRVVHDTLNLKIMGSVSVITLCLPMESSLPMLMGLRYKNAKCYQLFGPVEFRQIIRSLSEAFFFITSTGNNPDVNSLCSTLRYNRHINKQYQVLTFTTVLELILNYHNLNILTLALTDFLIELWNSLEATFQGDDDKSIETS
ncbi:thioredoxin-like fold protein [Artemisia annua]|uniref:Thioredoxin-like fold protein n=1 Tax=Artemisia annua TaxID=35608 RepID=A0A2U1NPI7_ARTAN|nr:thioredoxin-like fold protein [Artemisia annua]